MIQLVFSQSSPVNCGCRNSSALSFCPRWCRDAEWRTLVHVQWIHSSSHPHLFDVRDILKGDKHCNIKDFSRCSSDLVIIKTNIKKTDSCQDSNVWIFKCRWSAHHSCSENSWMWHVDRKWCHTASVTVTHPTLIPECVSSTRWHRTGCSCETQRQDIFSEWTRRCSEL